jgi:uncharacterized protein (UPF0548 family)
VFFLTKPTRQQIREFLDDTAKQGFSYWAVGETAQRSAPPGYVVDHNRQLLGHGQETFNRAVSAIENWKMFDFDWLELVHNSVPHPGGIVCVNVSHFGFHSLNACKVVYVVDERSNTTGSAVPCSGPGTITFGFAYGTLKDHAESGEERFCVEWNRADDAVHYDLYAFSKPGKLATRLVYPLARSFQHRFAQCSKAAMLRATRA